MSSKEELAQHFKDVVMPDIEAGNITSMFCVLVMGAKGNRSLSFSGPGERYHLLGLIEQRQQELVLDAIEADKKAE